MRSGDCRGRNFCVWEPFEVRNTVNGKENVEVWVLGVYVMKERFDCVRTFVNVIKCKAMYYLVGTPIRIINACAVILYVVN